MLTELYTDKVTIYNDVPATSAEKRHFDRYVLDRCNIQSGRVSRADGTIENIVNAITVWTKNVENYKDPRDYRLIPTDLRDSFWTAQIGDFVVFGEVDDIVETAADFQALQSKYKDNGLKITTTSPNIYGLNVDNVSFSNA